MAGALGNLLIMLTADTGQATSDIGRAAHQVERDMAAMQRNATIAGVVIGDAIGDIGRAFIQAGKDAVNFGDQLNKMSQKTNFSVERLSEMAFAAELADVSVSQVGTALGFFNKILSDAAKDGSKASEMFKALGVDITQGPQAAFEQFAKTINALPDGETKVATMRAMFGRAGDALLPMIKGLEEATAKANALGLVMSTQMAQDAERFNDAMTVLGTTARSLALTAMEPLTHWLANVADGMAKAKAEGSLFKNTLLEIGMFWASLWGGMAESVGAKPLADAMEAEFNRLRKLQEGLRGDGQTPGASGSWADPDAGGGNPEQLACVVSGGKWINGKCVPKAAAKGRAKKDDNLLGRQLQEDMDEWAKIMSQASAATDKYNQTLRDQEAEQMKLEVARAQSIIDMQEILDQQTRMANGWDENGRKIADNTKKTSDFAREMGLTFSSAFEDAIVGGKKFSDVLRGIGQDLVRIASRKLVTEPLGAAFSGLFSGGGSGSGFFDSVMASFGGGMATGGAVSGGTTYMVGEKGPELFTPSVSGVITPNHALGGGGGVTYIDARGADREGLARVEMLISSLNGSIERRAVAAVADSRRRHG